MASSVIEIRVNGPSGRLYAELQDELRDEFEQQGTVIQVVRLYSEPTLTTVAITIGVGVAIHLLSKLIDRLMKVREREAKKQPQISVNVTITNNTYNLPERAVCRMITRRSPGVQSREAMTLNRKSEGVMGRGRKRSSPLLALL